MLHNIVSTKAGKTLSRNFFLAPEKLIILSCKQISYISRPDMWVALCKLEPRDKKPLHLKFKSKSLCIYLLLFHWLLNYLLVLFPYSWSTINTCRERLHYFFIKDKKCSWEVQFSNHSLAYKQLRACWVPTKSLSGGAYVLSPWCKMKSKCKVKKLNISN